MTSVFGRVGDIVADAADYEPFYPLLTGAYDDPSWIASLDWAKITNPPTAPVSSVFGRSGAVVAAQNDYTFAQLAGKPTTLAGYGITDAESPLTFQQSLSRTANTINLAGDADPPGNSKYYGTDASGVRGWHDLPAAGGGPLAAYPVGSIYISVNATDPATLFGGTWVAFGTGRMLIGQDPADVDFDTAEEVGGAKSVTLSVGDLPSHTHGMDHYHTINHDHANATAASAGAHNHIPASGQFRIYLGSGGSGGSSAGSVLSQTQYTNTAGAHTHTVDIPTYSGNSGWASAVGYANTGAAGGGQAVNKMNPYIVVYMWKRTA